MPSSTIHKRGEHTTKKLLSLFLDQLRIVFQPFPVHSVFDLSKDKQN